MMKPRQSSGSRRVYWEVCSRPKAVAVLVVLFALQTVSETDQAVLTADVVNVVRVVRVDVPSVVRAHDAKPERAAGEVPPLLLGCAYALQGGENDDENGEVLAVGPSNATVRGERSPPELAMDAAMEELQRQRGLVVKWYFRRNPVPAVPNDAMAVINDNEQVYQWIAGGGPEAGGGLGPLSGRTVDVTAETPRADRSVLHRVIRVERPTAELTGEYRCQVEDWNAERRSVWHPMVVYTPERIFKVTVDDNDDDDEDDVSEGSGGDGNMTTPTPSTSSSAPQTAPKKWPTEINITCYAAGVHPEPSMSIWVNGVVQDSVTMVVTEDDGDDDETNDGEENGRAAATKTTTTTTTTTSTTTTTKPKVTYRNRYRMNRGDDTQYNKKYTVRADRTVSLKDAERLGAARNKQRRQRRNAVEVECRLRVPGDGAGNGYWKADRPAGLYYGARKSVVYKYRADPPPLSSDAFAAASSASSAADSDGVDGDADGVDGDADDDGEDTATAPGTGNGAAGRPRVRTLLVQSAVAAAAAAVAAVAVRR